MTTKPGPGPRIADEGSAAAPIVVDLGKVSRKKIKQLKKGKGDLVEEVGAVLQEIGASLPDADKKQLVPVVILWKPKRKKRRGILGF